MDILWRGAS